MTMHPRTSPSEPRRVDAPRPSEREAHVRRATRRRWPWLVALGLLAAVYGLRATRARQSASTEATGKPVGPGVPVVAATARQGDMPVYLSGLGSVLAFNTVTVKSRVDGQLVRVAFQEGQLVHQGDLLAEIDPRPFAAQLEQAEGQLARDQAQLKDAQINLVRFRELLARQLIAKQQLDTQSATVAQFVGTVRVDQATIDNARLQLEYAHITAPITGRVGLRLLDVGNMVHASDPNGLLVITQLQPIAVVFTLPEDELPPVMKKLTAGDPLAVEAYDRANRNRIATGSLLTVDNQIDQTTGTTRLKAVFANEDGVLFPNQFVNVHLLIDVRKGAVIVPVAAVQRGPQGTFVYLVKPDHTVDVRPVTVGPTTGTDTAIETGLAPDDAVVVDGVEKLRAGTPVQVRAPERNGAAAKPAA